MRIDNFFKLVCIAGLFTLGTSCSSDDDTGGEAQVIAPVTYTFERNNETTVSFSGIEGANDFSNTELNASGKSVRSKTAASQDYFSANTTAAAAIKEEFDGWIKSQVDDVFTNWSTEASAGAAGFLEEGGAEPPIRYINAKGLELNQAFGKSLIGALMVDQALNNYLGKAVLDAGDNVANNDNGILAEGKNYTTMEHKWDEAYGYLYGTSQDKTNPNATIGIADDIFDALKLGRAAIEAKNYTLRDEQAAVVREKISEIIGVRAVYYLQQGKNGLEAGVVDQAAVFHDLSEGFGFIYSLQFTRNPSTDAPYFDREEVQTLLNQLMEGTNGLWDVTPATLQTMSETIAAKFSFTVAQAGS